MVTPGAQTRDVVSFSPFSLVASETLLSKESLPVELGARALDMRARQHRLSGQAGLTRPVRLEKRNIPLQLKRTFSARAMPFSVDAPVMPQRPMCHSKNRGSRP